ncbi:hypothetical protein K4K58_008512 [Colletotrichum sp. SAR11_239]|nr:hypothetical protein K4K58_008512 [Colletotrichum sp. SAR11_239]
MEIFRLSDDGRGLFGRLCLPGVLDASLVMTGSRKTLEELVSGLEAGEEITSESEVENEPEDRAENEVESGASDEKQDVESDDNAVVSEAEAKEKRRFENFEKNSFRELPPEIRNMIYDLALARRQFIIYWDRSDKRLRQNPDCLVFGSLLRTCKTVHADARAMLYSTTFELEDMEYLDIWLQQIGPRAASIRAIKLSQPFQGSGARQHPLLGNFPLWNQKDYRATSRRVARLLSHCENLESLDLGFRYTLRYRNPALIKTKGNLKRWEVEARLLAEMVFSDLLPLLKKTKSLGKTSVQVANLPKIHPKNFEYIAHYRYVTNGEPEQEVARHMKLLVERYISG